MKKLEAIIFDMDGTIVDSMPFHEKAWSGFLEKKGKKYSTEEWNAIHHGTLLDIMPRIFGEGLHEQEYWDLGLEKEALFKEMYRGEVTPLPGLQALLESLKSAGIKTAVATAADRRNAGFTLDELGYHNYFNIVVTSNEVPAGKPLPDVYLFAAHCLKVNPENCIVFEDSSSGIESAHRAGMKVIGITTGIKDMSALPVEFSIPDYENINLADLQKLIADG